MNLSAPLLVLSDSTRFERDGVRGGQFVLTDHQWERVSEAVERGYYGTPRGSTVTELAESFGIHKSAVPTPAVSPPPK